MQISWYGFSYDFNTSFQLHGKFKFIPGAAAEALGSGFTYARAWTTVVKVINLYAFVVATSHEFVAFFDNLHILLACGISANKI